MRIAVLPGLWIDWCAVTSTDLARRDDEVLTCFERQTGASARTLKKLRPRIRVDGPAWPLEHREDADSLRRLLRHGSRLTAHPDLDWISRLRMRWLLFLAVLVAPAGHGGLGMTRQQIRELTTQDLDQRRAHVGVGWKEQECPACAVWSWLEVIGEASRWSHASVRALAHRSDTPGSTHRHTRVDPSPDWRTSPAPLPNIDRWGYLDNWASLHPSSTSTLMPALRTLLEVPPSLPTSDPEPRPVVRHVSEGEQEAIFARADEILARVRAALAEFD